MDPWPGLDYAGNVPAGPTTRLTSSLAQMARCVPQTQQHRRPTPCRLRKRLRPPGPPVHRIVGVLQQVGRGRVSQAVHHDGQYPSRPGTRGDDPIEHAGADRDGYALRRRQRERSCARLGNIIESGLIVSMPWPPIRRTILRSIGSGSHEISHQT